MCFLWPEIFEVISLHGASAVTVCLLEGPMANKEKKYKTEMLELEDAKVEGPVAEACPVHFNTLPVDVATDLGKL